MAKTKFYKLHGEIREADNMAGFEKTCNQATKGCNYMISLLKKMGCTTQGTPKRREAKAPAPRYWYCPDAAPSPLASQLAKQAHLMIAGATGSGKSVLLNSIIYDLMRFSPMQKQFILIDPKRVELVQYRNLPHTMRYASEPEEMLAALRWAVFTMEKRYEYMQKMEIRDYEGYGADIYVIVDEYADLIVTQKKAVKPLFIRLAQLGRAAHIHLIICTQRPTRDIIDGAIKVNLDSRVALRCPTPQDSRNIIDVKGAEDLPRYGFGLYRSPDGIKRVEIAMIPEPEIMDRVKWWTDQQRDQAQFETDHKLTRPEWAHWKNH